MARSTRSSALRKTRSFSLDPHLILEVERTKGDGSVSERVNQLLGFALEMERKAALYQEAREFYGRVADDPEERKHWREAGMRSWERD